MRAAIEVSGVSKAFGATRAVRSLDLCVEPGDVYGFLGRNGAGKTTTIRMLLGMIGADEGTIRVLGQTVARNRGPWRAVGSLVESAAAWPDLTVAQNAQTIAELHGMKDRGVQVRLLEQLGLAPLANQKAGTLSLGNLQRLALALALVADPQVLILDEPGNGLDPAGIVEIRQLLVGLAGQGKTVFVSSHQLDEVARTATRIGIVHQGQLVEELDREALARFLTRRLVVRTSDRAGAAAALARSGIEARPGADPDSLDVGSVEPERIAPVLVAAGVALTGLAVEREDLEGHFLRLTGGEA